MQFIHLEDRYVNYENKDELEVYIRQGLSLEIDINQVRKIVTSLQHIKFSRARFSSIIKRRRQSIRVRQSVTCLGIKKSERNLMRNLDDRIHCIETLIKSLNKAIDKLRCRSLRHRTRLEKKKGSKLMITKVFVTFRNL
ncbi:MAG: hypothetical protein S4CHLAM27_05740 [Chlamydiia bacterium]|nr:hypothetical protein [Chlamydiia bacterium]